MVMGGFSNCKKSTIGFDHWCPVVKSYRVVCFFNHFSDKWSNPNPQLQQVIPIGIKESRCPSEMIGIWFFKVKSCFPDFSGFQS
jgi:hypothetical protein